jgi:hypothetical protein
MDPQMTQAILERATKRAVRKEMKEKKIEELKNEVYFFQVLQIYAEAKDSI